MPRCAAPWSEDEGASPRVAVSPIVPSHSCPPLLNRGPAPALSARLSETATISAVQGRPDGPVLRFDDRLGAEEQILRDPAATRSETTGASLHRSRIESSGGLKLQQKVRRILNMGPV
jgi:hypothetical protein